MIRMLMVIVVALTCLSPGAGLTSDKDYSGHFGDMDTNKDKGVSWEEFKAFFPHAEQEKFREADLNKDAKIDHGEWHTFKEKHGYGHKKGS